MNTKKPAASYYPCPVKASSIFVPQPPPIPMYYARNPVRLTFEDADWGTLTDDEESGSEQGLSSRSLLPTKAFIRPNAAGMSPHALGTPLGSAPGALGTAAEVKHCGVESNTEQRQRPTPGKLLWTDSLNQVDQASSLAPAALPVVTHKDAPHSAQISDTSCLLSRSKVKVNPVHVVDRNEQRQSVPRAAFIPPKDATRSLPPVFSDSDDECDDPLAAQAGGQPRKQDGGLEPGCIVEVGRCVRSYSDSHPGEVWAMLIAERSSN
jgi:hypothetical protein